jgi:hypothetical protein
MRSADLTARWNIRVTGCRHRRRIALTDHAGEVLAKLAMPRRKRRRRRKPGTATGADGTEWTLQYAKGDRVEVRSGGLVVATAEVPTLEVGGRRHRLKLRDEGPRSATAVPWDGGRPALRVRADLGHRNPWATLYVDPDLEQPLPAALALSYLLLAMDANEESCCAEALCELLTSW